MPQRAKGGMTTEELNAWLGDVAEWGAEGTVQGVPMALNPTVVDAPLPAPPPGPAEPWTPESYDVSDVAYDVGQYDAGGTADQDYGQGDDEPVYGEASASDHGDGQPAADQARQDDASVILRSLPPPQLGLLPPAPRVGLPQASTEPPAVDLDLQVVPTWPTELACKAAYMACERAVGKAWMLLPPQQRPEYEHPRWQAMRQAMEYAYHAHNYDYLLLVCEAYLDVSLQWLQGTLED